MFTSIKSRNDFFQSWIIQFAFLKIHQSWKSFSIGINFIQVDIVSGNKRLKRILTWQCNFQKKFFFLIFGALLNFSLTGRTQISVCLDCCQCANLNLGLKWLLQSPLKPINRHIFGWQRNFPVCHLHCTEWSQ